MYTLCTTRVTPSGTYYSVSCASRSCFYISIFNQNFLGRWDRRATYTVCAGSWRENTFFTVKVSCCTPCCCQPAAHHQYHKPSSCHALKTEQSGGWHDCVYNIRQRFMINYSSAADNSGLIRIQRGEHRFGSVGGWCGDGGHGGRAPKWGGGPSGGEFEWTCYPFPSISQ